MLTVFIATHNGGRTLPRVLDAYTQLVPPPGGWKVVLIDNGSDDDSPRIIRSFLDRLPLALVSEPRRGKNRALNRGLGELEGDLAVFSDDDVLPARDWLVQLRAAADQHPECGAFGGHILPAWDVPPDEWVRDWVPSAPVFGVSGAPRESGPCEPTKIWGSNMAVRAEWLRRGHRFDERHRPEWVGHVLDGWRDGVHAAPGARRECRVLALRRRPRVAHHRRAADDARVRAEARVPSRPLRPPRVGAARPRGAAARAARAARHRQGLTRALASLASARRSADARRAFEARWQLSLWAGCLYEALGSRYAPQGPTDDGRITA